MQTFYRLVNHKTQQGLWYDMNGEFTGLIHGKYNFCKNRDLKMPFDPNIAGWLSATETIDELFTWFSQSDIATLEEYGYRIAIYKASEFKWYNNHWLIKQDTSQLVEYLTLSKTTLPIS